MWFYSSSILRTLGENITVSNKNLRVAKAFHNNFVKIKKNKNNFYSN